MEFRKGEGKTLAHGRVTTNVITHATTTLT